MSTATAAAPTLDLRDTRELSRLADAVAGRYLLSRSEGRTIRLILDEELRALLDLIGEIQGRIGEPA